MYVDIIEILMPAALGNPPSKLYTLVEQSQRQAEIILVSRSNWNDKNGISILERLSVSPIEFMVSGSTSQM
jgi:uncharacterized protein (UPF0210 family)